MNVRRWSTGAVLTLGLVLAAPAVASAAPDTPAGTGGGCKENGQAIAGAASGPGAFGQFVRRNVPIAQDNARFFTELCRGS